MSTQTSLSGTRSNKPVNNNSIQGIEVVWFDPKNSEYLNRKARLRSIGNYLKKFDDINLFINYLLSNKLNSRKLFLILPGSYGKKILPFIYDETNIAFIYIFCKDEEKHKEWTELYLNKLRGIFVDKEQLLTKLNTDIDFYTKMIPITVVPEKKLKKETSCYNLNEEEALFMWNQLLIEILNRMPLTSISRKDLLNECREEYQGDNIELCKIQEFEDTYNADNVIEWYTRDAFLYRLLNRALRTRDISIIFRFRFVLVDLHNRLSDLHVKYIDLLDETANLTVYRGQGLTISELTKLKGNINGRIAMNSFTSTSLSSATALEFAGNGTGRPLIESVLFEIECPIKLSTKPYANIQKYSYLKTEDEILFTIGTTFRIESVEQYTDDIWLVKLILCEDGINSIKDELIDQLKSEIDQTADVLTLARFLYQMNDLDKAEEFYTLLLNELPSRHSDVITIKNDLGGIYREKGEYLQALQTHKEALKLHRLMMPHDFVQRAAIYNDIGYVYEELSDYFQSLKYHKKTLRIRRKHQPYYKIHFATTFDHLANVYNQIGRKTLALEYHMKGLKIKKKYCAEINPELANTYNNIGEVYLSMQNIETARVYFEKSLEIRLKSLPSDHRDLAISHSNLGQIYDYNNDHKKGLEYHQKSLNILLKCLPSNHIDLAATYTNVGASFSNLDDSTSALINYKKAFRIQCNLLCTPRVQADAVVSCCNIGVLYEGQKKYKIALKYFRRARRLAVSAAKNTKLLAIVYYDIATVYHNKSNIRLAMKYYNKALKFELQSHESNSSLDLAKIYFGLGQIYEKKNDLKNALIQFEKSFDIRKRCLKLDHPLIEETLSTMGFVYSKDGDNEKALTYFKEALNLQLKSESIYLASTCISIGSIYHKKEDLENALLYYQKALKYATNDEPELGPLYYQIGLIYDDKKDFDMALENYQNSFKFPSKIDSIIVDMYNRIGQIYRQKRDYPNALISYKKALDICKEQDKKTASIYYNLAWVYDDKHEHNNALKFYKKALNENRKQKLPGLDLFSKIYNNIAGIHARSNKFKLALNYFKRSLRIKLTQSIPSSDYADIAIVYSNIGTLYIFLSNYQMALKNYEKALDFALKKLSNDDPTISQYRANIATAKRHLQLEND
ncbi:unnamed protein product [Rotaria sp. Silwood2]|nr:unnamed protein product [Rotaria sp. Silwood2]